MFKNIIKKLKSRKGNSLTSFRYNYYDEDATIAQHYPKFDAGIGENIKKRKTLKLT